MPRVQVDYSPRAEALQTTAAPNIQAIKAQYDPRASSAFQLAEALGKQQPLLDKFNEDMQAEQRRKEILDNMKVPAFVAKAQAEQGAGVIDGVQAGKVAPGTSTVVQARTNDGLGDEWGRTNVQRIIDGVNNNAELIQDPEQRARYIRDEKAKLLSELPKDNDFFVSGAVTRIGKELDSFENKWQAKSDAYHLEVQTKDFSNKVVEAMTSDNPDQNLLKLDETWKNSSALSNVRRNELVVETITKKAYGDRDPTLLGKIPERFLNAETKASITRTRAAIQELKMSDHRIEQTFRGERREEAIRNGKFEILKQVAAGKDVDPAQYASNPDTVELYQFANTMREAPRRPAAESSANLQRIRQSILNRATVEGVDTNVLIDEAMKNPYLNPADRDKLVNEMPKLVEGMIAMNDDMVKSAYSTRIGASLEEAAKNPMVVLSPTLRSRTVNLYDQTVRNSFNAYYDENKKWPTGRAKQDIVDSAVDRTEAFMQQQLQGSKGGAAAPAPAAPKPAAPAAAPKPAAAPAAGPVVKITGDADYNKLKSGTRFVGPDGITRTKP